MFDLRRFAFDYNLSQAALGRILGIDQSAVSMMVNGNRKFREEHLALLRAKYGDCVDSYIVNKEVAKAFSQPISQQVTATIIPAEVVADIKKEQPQQANSPEVEEVKETIVITTDEVRSPDFNLKKEVLRGSLEENAKPTQSIIPEHDVKVYSYCDDMAPEIKAGEAVLVRFVPNTVRIIPGNMYFVDLPTSGLIRYVFEQPNGDLLLRAANALYPDLVVPRTEVLSISMVVLILKRPSSASSDTRPLTDAIERRDRQIDNLIAIIDKKL